MSKKPINVEVKGVSKFVKVSPTKIRQVLKQLKGKTYSEALLKLTYMPHAACTPICKLLRSVAANAKYKFGRNQDLLVITSAFVNLGPKSVRFRPRAQGRAYKISKFTSHITIVMKYI